MVRATSTTPTEARRLNWLPRIFGHWWLALLAFCVGAALSIIPISAYTTPIEMPRDEFEVFVEPLCPDCLSEAVMGPVQLTVREDFGVAQAFGTERTARIGITATASVPRADFESADDGRLDWKVYITPGITWTQAQERVCVLVSGCFTDADFTEAGEWTLVEDPFSYVTLGFTHVVKLGDLPEDPASERVLVQLNTEVKVRQPFTHKSRSDWLENWRVVWQPDGLAKEYRVVPTSEIETFPWMNMTDRQAMAVPMGQVPVEFYVCPSCAPVSGYAELAPISLATLRDETTANVREEFNWSTAWAPWNWVMPIWIPFAISTVVAFFFSLSGIIWKLRLQRIAERVRLQQVEVSRAAQLARLSKKRRRSNPNRH